jgi:predicted kinase
MKKHPLILLCGLSGSGKTTTAKHLAKTFDHCVALHAEEVRQDLGIKKYSRADTPRMLTAQMIRLQSLWLTDRTGIVDNNMLSPVLRQMYYDLARDEGRLTLLLCLTAPYKVLQNRISSRTFVQGGPPNDPEVLKRQLLFWEEPVTHDACINDSEFVTMVKFDTFDQSLTCIQGVTHPYSRYLYSLLEIKETLDD